MDPVPDKLSQCQNKNVVALFSFLLQQDKSLRVTNDTNSLNVHNVDDDFVV